MLKGYHFIKTLNKSSRLQTVSSENAVSYLWGQMHKVKLKSSYNNKNILIGLFVKLI